MPDLQTFADTVQTRLSTISGLRVYQGPVARVNEFPCAVIDDHDPVARYTLASEEAVYFLTVTILDNASDPEEAWKNLEPYLAADGGQSIRSALDLTSDPDMAYIHVITASNRHPIHYAGASYWGSVLLVEGRANVP